jgi:transcriptional accessory protein Tex/SPT6
MKVLTNNVLVAFGLLLSVINFDFTTSFLSHNTKISIKWTRIFSMSDKSYISSDSQFNRRRWGTIGGKPPDQRDPYVQKADAKVQSDTDPDVISMFALEDRVALSTLSAGQKMRGRIVSVKDFGLFVDIGAKRDGLVHVKDISKDYFISNHELKFIPGQDIDVWVKFVEEETFKLGLQMFPVSDRLAIARNKPITLSLTDTQRKDKVVGIVTRASNYGLFIDIGSGGVDAFLHLKRMR